MRFWISKNGDVPIHDQLTTQIRLGILSNDLKPHEKLPSTRQLGRLLKVHSNTISSAYQELVARGWLEFRKGSGVYVKAEVDQQPPESGLELDGLISRFFKATRDAKFPLREVQSRLKHFLEMQPPDHFLVVEQDDELRDILISEIKDATGWVVNGIAPADCADRHITAGAVLVATQYLAAGIKSTIHATIPFVTLQTRSIPSSLHGEKPLPDDYLVTVVSSWSKFLQWAETILVAAGIDANAISVRDARRTGWKRGLSQSSLIITDLLTSSHLPKDIPTRVFRLIADESLDEMRSLVGSLA
jgi:DNA-binding transcriptional regulator YhcF (GntR family)